MDSKKLEREFNFALVGAESRKNMPEGVFLSGFVPFFVLHLLASPAGRCIFLHFSAEETPLFLKGRN